MNLPCWWHSSQQKLSCGYFLMLSSSSRNSFWAYRRLIKLPKVGVIINEINIGELEFVSPKFGWVHWNFSLEISRVQTSLNWSSFCWTLNWTWSSVQQIFWILDWTWGPVLNGLSLNWSSELDLPTTNGDLQTNIGGSWVWRYMTMTECKIHEARGLHKDICSSWKVASTSQIVNSSQVRNLRGYKPLNTQFGNHDFFQVIEGIHTLEIPAIVYGSSFCRHHGYLL